jgi:methylglutaconyl-CoA hydratase
MKNIIVENKRNIAYITLNRPEVHNAFDEETIAELTAAFDKIEADHSVRALVIKGEGKSFCAGGDLNWMKRTANFTLEENTKDAAGLATMLYTLYSVNIPTIALVHGHVFGGGVGVAAACDIVIADTDTQFALSEVKLGLIPAVISPYVFRAMGGRHMKRYAQTAEIFSAEKAEKINLVHEISKDAAHAETILKNMLNAITHNAPQAMSLAKQLAEVVGEASLDDDTLLGTAEWIANRRATDEGKEGIQAFLEKRSPNWIKGK